MALLPDPTTAASERSSVKNRLTGSRRRGSGNSQQNEFKRPGPEPRPGGPGSPGLSRGVQGASRGGSMGGAGALGAIKAKNAKKH